MDTRSVHLPITKSGWFLDIIIILWRISPVIQHVPLNEQNGDSNQLSRRIVHWPGLQTVFPVVILKDHSIQQTIQQKWQDQEHEPHVNSTDLRR
jgi:hypothetical protein